MPANLMTNSSVNEVMGGSQDENLLASGNMFEEQNAVGVTDELIEMGADAEYLSNEHNLFGSKKKKAAAAKGEAPPAKKKIDFQKTFADIGAGIGVAKQGVDVVKDVADTIKGTKKKPAVKASTDTDSGEVSNGIPTWVWIGGGVLVVGIIGFVIWKVRQNKA